MSIKEKKTIKGNTFAIVKFGDLSKVFELFLFSEILEKNRDNLIEGKSFLLTVIKDDDNSQNRFKRFSVRKIISMQNVINTNYDSVYIEIDTAENLKNLYENIKERGGSKIKIAINSSEKNYLFELKDKRKFNYSTLQNLNKKQYIKKIRV